MQPLVCKMCGSTMLHEKENFLVCHYCSCKYTAKEINEMKTEKAKAENFFALAQAAYKADNLAEAAYYCNKIIEIDVTHYEAWLFKSRLSLYSQNPENVRFAEVVYCCNQAAKYCPDEVLPQIIPEMDEDLVYALDHLFELHCTAFEAAPSLENANCIVQYFNVNREAFLEINYATAINIDAYYTRKASLLNTITCNIWAKTVLPAYIKIERPKTKQWQAFINQAFGCLILLETAIGMSDCDAKADVTRYKNQLSIIDKVINSHSWKLHQGTGNIWLMDCSLDEQTKDDLIKKAYDCHCKIHAFEPEHEIPPIRSHIV